MTASWPSASIVTILQARKLRPPGVNMTFPKCLSTTVGTPAQVCVWQTSLHGDPPPPDWPLMWEGPEWSSWDIPHHSLWVSDGRKGLEFSSSNWGPLGPSEPGQPGSQGRGEALGDHPCPPTPIQIPPSPAPGCVLQGRVGHRAVLHREGRQPGPHGRRLLLQVLHGLRAHPVAKRGEHGGVLGFTPKRGWGCSKGRKGR